MKFVFTLLISIQLLLMSLTVIADEPRKNEYSFAFVPQQAASKLTRLWLPILTYIGNKNNLVLKFRTAPNIPEFEKRVANGDYDFAYMNPYHYTIFSEEPGYRAFAKQKDKKITGIVVIRIDSAVKTIQDLSGKTLAFPAPAAFAATVLPKASFQQQGILIKSNYVLSHDSVYRAVAAGFVIAGGGIQRTFSIVNPQIRSKLKILWKTKSYTPHAFAAKPTVPINIVKKIQKTLIEMENDPSTINFLDNIKFKGFEKANDHDWDDVRSLKIKLIE